MQPPTDHSNGWTEEVSATPAPPLDASDMPAPMDTNAHHGAQKILAMNELHRLGEVERKNTVSYGFLITSSCTICKYVTQMGFLFGWNFLMGKTPPSGIWNEA